MSSAFCNTFFFTEIIKPCHRATLICPPVFCMKSSNVLCGKRGYCKSWSCWSHPCVIFRDPQPSLLIMCVCECDLAIIGTYVLQFICESIGKKLYILSYEKKRIIFFLIKLLSESFEIFVLFFFFYWFDKCLMLMVWNQNLKLPITEQTVKFLCIYADKPPTMLKYVCVWVWEWVYVY